MTNLTILETIIEQLGGREFFFMTRSKPLKRPNGVSFVLKKNKSKANYLDIVLKPNDTYTVTFYKYKQSEAIIISQYDGIYYDQLRSLFEEETGFDTRMPKIYVVKGK